MAKAITDATFEQETKDGLVCCVNTSNLFHHLAVFFEEKSWDRHDSKSTSCVWIFINVHFNDF